MAKKANGEIKIQKNIAMPKNLGTGRPKYPWKELEVGESFLFPEGLGESGIHSNAQSTGKRLNRKFAIRKTPEGYRCWRIA